MASFVLRDVDDKLWSRVKSRAALEQTSLKAVALRLFRLYADGKVVNGKPPKEKSA